MPDGFARRLPVRVRKAADWAFFSLGPARRDGGRAVAFSAPALTIRTVFPLPRFAPVHRRLRKTNVKKMACNRRTWIRQATGATAAATLAATQVDGPLSMFPGLRAASADERPAEQQLAGEKRTSEKVADERRVEEAGVTAASERASKRGGEWLARVVGRDGGCGVDVGQTPDIGCTALVGLAWLAEGHTPIEGVRSREVRQIISFLVRAADEMPRDDITSALQTQLQTKIGRHVHSFLAAILLSQVVGEGWEVEPAQRALRRVVDAIVAAQTPDGHWGTNSWAPTLGTVLGWMSLRAAHFAGLRVGRSPETTARHLARQLSGGVGSGSWMHTLYKNATSIRVLHALGEDDQPAAQQALADAVRLVAADNTPFTQAGGEEFLAFHLITETLRQKGGSEWNRWFPMVRDKIIAVQNSDGSWSGAHCITSRTFCTAAAVLVLAAPRRYLPLSQL